MAEYDVAVGLDVDTLTAATAAVYQAVYPKVFTGSHVVEHTGIEFEVGWDVTAPPRVALIPPPEGRTLIREHLAEHLALPEGITIDQVVDAYAAELEDTVFQVIADSMTMTISGGGEHATEPVSVTLYARVESVGGKLHLRPLKATGRTENPVDEWFLNNVILPEAIEVGGELLPAVDLPPLQFADVGLTAPAVALSPRHGVALAALDGKPDPVPPFSDEWPTSSFFAVLSDEAKLAVATMGVRSVNGQTFGDKGKVGIGIGTAHYEATCRISGIDVGLASPGAPELTFDAGVTGKVRAGVSIGCVDFGVNYTLYSAPTPSGTIGLELSGTEVRARTRHVNTFVLLITPDGSPVEWILSAMTTPVLQAVAAAFSPLITKAFEGIDFPVMTLPSVPFDAEGVHVVVSPTDCRFGTWSGMTTIEGTARVGS